MTIETTKENLCINKLVCEKKEIIFVEGDMIIPDSKPDILNTINTSGTVCIYKKEVMDDKIRIDGNINTYIMYLADSTEDNVRGVNTSLDFSESINLPNCRPEMMEDSNFNVKSIECKVLNGRKISIKVTLEVTVKIYSNEDIQIINQIDNNEDIQVLNKNMKVNSLIGNGSTKVYIKDNIPIDNVDNLAEILKSNINLVDRDIKISYNKVLAKTEAEIKIMYLTEDNRINCVTNKIPVVGFIDIQDVSENNICDTNYQIKNMILKPNNIEEHSIYIELEVEIACMAYEEKELNIIQDLYSPCQDVRFEQKQMKTISNKNNMRETCKIREKVNIPEIANQNIIDVDINVNITKETTINSKIMYEGEVELNFIFASNTNVNINTKMTKIPFEYEVNDIENCENRNINTNIEIGENNFIALDSGNVDCNIDLILNISMSQSIGINVIGDIMAEENRDLEDYSVIMYIVKEGDTLWKIAKAFRSTIDDIVRVNGIEDPDKIEVGRKIFIPKYVKPRTISYV